MQIFGNGVTRTIYTKNKNIGKIHLSTSIMGLFG